MRGTWRRARHAARTAVALGLAAAVAGGIGVSASQADSTVIGSTTLPAGSTGSNFGPGVAAFQNLAGSSAYVVSSPVAGTLTSWSFRSGNLGPGTPANALVLRILRPTGVGPTQYTAAGTSAAQTVPDATDRVLGPFPISLPIQAGDRIALENTSANGTVPILAGVPGASVDFLSTPSLADGSASGFTDGGVTPNNTQLLVQATVTYTPSATNPTPPATPPPPSTPQGRLASLAPPVAGVSVNVVPVRGTVSVRPPGGGAFTPLSSIGKQIPVGSEVDATRGAVRLVAARASGSTLTKSADFYGGRFRISQRRGADAVEDNRLTGPLGTCAPIFGRAARAARRGGPRRRHLWGSGQGTFSTSGQRGAAAVRGTVWLVEDRCDGSTLVVVRRGVIAFRDFGRHRTVTLRAGQRYLAALRRSRPTRRC